MAEIRLVRSAIPKAALEKVRSILLSLDDAKLREINSWLRSHLTELLAGEIDDSLVRSAASGIGASRSDFIFVLGFFGSLVVSAEEAETFGPQIKELGLEDLADRVQLVLEGLSLKTGEVEYVRQRMLAVQTAIPTLEEANALCDLRAIFRRFPSPSQSETHKKSAKVLLGFEPIAIVSLELNDAAGNDSIATFQVTEKGLRNLVETLREALTQLEIIKKAQETIGVSGEES